MDINSAFPSKFLKAADLQGKKIKVTIERVEMQDFDGTPKPVIYFQGKEKGLATNRTNAMVIASAYGPETDGWTGKEIALYTAKVSFQGQMIDALRVEIPQQEAAPDESIPF